MENITASNYKTAYEYLKQIGVKNPKDSEIEEILNTAQRDEDGKITKDAFEDAAKEIYKIDINSDDQKSIEAWTKFAGKDEVLDANEISQLISSKNTTSTSHSASSTQNHPSTLKTASKTTATAKDYSNLSLEQLESEKEGETTKLNSISEKLEAVNSGTDPEVAAAKQELDDKEKAYKEQVENDPKIASIKNDISQNLKDIASLETQITTVSSSLNDYISKQAFASNNANAAYQEASALNAQANSIVMPNESDFEKREDYEAALSQAQAQKDALIEKAKEKSDEGDVYMLEAERHATKIEELKTELTTLSNDLTTKNREKDTLEEQIANTASDISKQKLAEYNQAKDNLATIKSAKIEALSNEFAQVQTNINTLNSKIAEAKALEAKKEAQNSSKNTTYKEVVDSGDVLTNVANFNTALKERNEEEARTEKIHGMSDSDYAEFSQIMEEKYGYKMEPGYNYGNFQNVAYSLSYACSHDARFYSQCEAAKSYDSVLDLVLDAKLAMAIEDICKGDTDPSWKTLMNSQRLLKDYGIKAFKTREGNYCFSLVDSDGNIIQDENGNLAQIYKNDYLMPDGQAQRCEILNGAVLDQMGFDCMSMLDVTPEEYEMIKEMAKLDNSKLGVSSGIKGDDKAAIKEKVIGADRVEFQDREDWLAQEKSGMWDYSASKHSKNTSAPDPAVWSAHYELSSAIEKKGKEIISNEEFSKKIEETMKKEGCDKGRAAIIVARTYAPQSGSVLDILEEMRRAEDKVEEKTENNREDKK